MRTSTLFGLALKIAPYFLKRQSQPQPGFSEKDRALLNLKEKEGAVIVILGARGTGKTEMAYRLAEFLGKPTYAVSPEQKPHPSFIEDIKLEEVEEKVKPNSTVIFDDLPIYFSNRSYNESLTRELEKIIPMVRHERKWHIIFSSQSAAQADRYILDCDAAFLKPLGILMQDIERPNIARLYRNLIDPEFEGRDDYWIQKHCYMITREYKGILEVKKVN